MWACIQFCMHLSQRCKVIKMTYQQQKLWHDVTYDIMIWDMILEGFSVFYNHLLKKL
jgi:hypothetical protein